MSVFRQSCTDLVYMIAEKKNSFYAGTPLVK